MAGQGTRITASDFNAIQSIVANVFGTGAGTYGYGQTVTSSQVSVGTAIRAAGWNALYNDMIAARQHQTGVNESGNLPTITSNTLVSETGRAAYYNFAVTLQNAANTIASSGQSSVVPFASSTRSSSFTNTTVVHTLTLSFANSNYARYYFNTGGNVQFSGSLSGFPGSGGSLDLDNDWARLLGAMGTISMNYNSTSQVPRSATYPTAGSTPTGSPALSVGFYQLTTTPQVIFTKTASTYTGNQYRIYASVNANSNPNIVTFSIRFEDPATGPGGALYEPVLGTLTSNVQGTYASGSNVSVSSSNSAGLSYLPSITSSGP